MTQTTAPTRTERVAPAYAGRVKRLLKPLAWASLVANGLLVVTGGAVRLSGSGLGCPTWPRCTDAAFTPHGAYSIHAAIEFGNRMLTGVLVVVAVATLLAAILRHRREVVWPAAILFGAIPAQIVLGGITVLTDLNPWVVSLHLLISLAMVGVATVLVRTVDGPLTPARRGPVTTLAWATFATTWAVLYVGTVVTGAGPHAGDVNAPRNGLSPRDASQLHADLVFLFVGLTVGLLVTALVTGADARSTRAIKVLLGVELAQAVIGFVQYFTHVPAVLVGFHMLGAAVISAAMTWALLTVRHPASDPSRADRGPSPDQRTTEATSAA